MKKYFNECKKVGALETVSNNANIDGVLDTCEVFCLIHLLPYRAGLAQTS